MKHCRTFDFFERKRARCAFRVRRGGFTLLEVLLASLAASMILASIYGIFTNAVRMRDKATLRTHDSQLRARAARVIRNDLENAYVSGGVLAAAIEGSDKGPDSQFPGYLKFTTTTAKDTDDEMRGDVQQISYYVVSDDQNPSREAGLLVRAVDRNLLARVRDGGHEEQLLTGVSALEVSFFDGTNWANTWSYTPPTSGTNSANTNSNVSTGTALLPEAVRVRITQVASSDKVPTPPPLEILVPWVVQPLTTTPVTSGTTPVVTEDEEGVIPDQQEGERAGYPGEDPEDEDTGMDESGGIQ